MAATGSPAHRGRHPTVAKYDVLEELGHGGMATVYRAHDARLGRDVAIKVIHPHLRDSPEIAHRFSVEAQAVAKLRHPNIVEVYDVSAPDEPEQYLVVELLRGKTLRRIIQENGALPPEVAAALGIELLGALAHAHTAGVIHRDIKPENVIVEQIEPQAPHSANEEGKTPRPVSADPLGERVKVKLTDFGIAKLLDAQGVTSTGQVLGSPAHMAPEQIEGGEVDARADVFALGVLLYECMVGHLPFEGSNPAQVLRRVLEGFYPSAERERPLIGKTWSAILDRALAHDAGNRYRDATEMRDAISEEMKRLGIPSARAELEAWGDDPQGFTACHDKKLIARLCDLAAKSRRTGNALGAAADYNRALAYAPHDQALLKIVSSIHRTEARLAFLKRVAPMVVAMGVLCVSAYFITGAIRHRLATQVPVVVKETPPPASVIAPIPSTVVSVATIKPPPVVTYAPIQRVATPPPKPIERAIAVSSVRPPYGVFIAVDGDPAVTAKPGLKITLDGRAHTLGFSCARDACEPSQRQIEASDHDETIAIVLTIKPAALTVEGDPKSTYSITEEPTVSLRNGVPAQVPMRDGRVSVHVREFPSNHVESVTLIAGQSAHVSFSADPAP
jgi:serine/threonine protein kinase